MERVRAHRVANKGPIARTVAGNDPTFESITVVGESELNAWCDLAAVDELADAATAREHQDRADRRAKSLAHQSGWRDTVLGQVQEKRQRRIDVLEAAESRRVAIDNAEREFQQELRAAKILDAQEKLLARDPRMVVLNAAVLQQSVHKEREQQELLAARLKDAQLQRDAEYMRQLVEQARRDDEVEQAIISSARQKTVEARAQCKAQLEAVKDERRLQRAAEREEGRRLRAIAEQDAELMRQENIQRRAEAVELNYFRVKQISQLQESGLSPTKPGSLQGSPSARSDRSDQAADERFIRRKMELFATAEEEARRKKDLALQRSVVATTALTLQLGSLNNPKTVLQELMETKHQSVSDRMARDDDGRIASSRTIKERTRDDLDRQVALTSRVKSSVRQEDQQRGQLLAERIRGLEVEDRAEQLLARHKREELANLRLLQAREKASNEARERQETLLAGREQIQRLKEIENDFQTEIVSRIPDDMEPGIVRRVLRKIK